jgi:hypothetical protein
MVLRRVCRRATPQRSFALDGAASRRDDRPRVARATRVLLHPRAQRHTIFPLTRDGSRATTTMFSDDCGSAGAIGWRGRGGAVLHAVRSLRQRRLPQLGVADRSERSRRCGKGCAAPARRIPAGHGIGALPARHFSVRRGGLEDADHRRERRRVSSRESSIGERPTASPCRVRGRPRTGCRAIRTRKLQITLLPRHRRRHARSLRVDHASMME